MWQPAELGARAAVFLGGHILGWPGEATASAARELQAESVSWGSHQCHPCFRAPHQLLLSCGDPGPKGLRLFTKPLHAWLFASPRRRELWTSSWPLGSVGNGDGCGQDRPSHRSPHTKSPQIIHFLALSGHTPSLGLCVGQSSEAPDLMFPLWMFPLC